MVGYAHADADAEFSCIRAKLSKNDEETMQELLSLLPNSQHMATMYNVKSLLELHIPNISQLILPLHYKFLKFGNDVHACFKGRHDNPWILLNSQFLKGRPTENPDILIPDFY